MLGALLTYIARQRDHPSACPYSLRFSLDFPHPSVTRSRLREMLSPQPGERVLEIGPGTGYYSLHAVRWLEPEGTLEVWTSSSRCSTIPWRRAYTLGISNIVPTRGDAQTLTYTDGRFDSAYLVATLGEVPDQGRALRELRRVLKRGGRLVVGEVLLDLHRVSFSDLRRMTDEAGLGYERRIEGWLGYFASFRA